MEGDPGSNGKQELGLVPWGNEFIGRNAFRLSMMPDAEMIAQTEVPTVQPGNPLPSHHELDGLIDEYEVGYQDLREQVRENEAALHRLISLILDGKNVIISGNHQDAVGQALVFGAIKSSVMEILDDYDHPELQANFSVVMAHLMRVLEAPGSSGTMDMTDPPKIAADEVILTMPTKSDAVDRYFPEGTEEGLWAKTMGRKAARIILERLIPEHDEEEREPDDRDSQVMSMTLSGSTDKRAGDTVTVQRVQDPSAKLAASDKVDAVFQFAQFIDDQGEQHFRVVGIYHPESADEVHNMMHDTTSMLNAMSSQAGLEMSFRYGDPNRQVRSSSDEPESTHGALAS